MSSGLFSLGDDEAENSGGDHGGASIHRPTRSDLRSVYFKRDSTLTQDEGIYLDLYGNKKSGKSKSSPLLSLRRALDRDKSERQQPQSDETSFRDLDRPSGSGSVTGSPSKVSLPRSPMKASSRDRFTSNKGSPPYKGSPIKSPSKSPTKSKTSKKEYERPKFDLDHSPPTSPVNSSGVQIVIEPGTDSAESMSPPVEPDTQTANCDYLTVDHAYSNDTASKYDSTTSSNPSQVYLLSEIR